MNDIKDKKYWKKFIGELKVIEYYSLMAAISEYTNEQLDKYMVDEL